MKILEICPYSEGACGVWARAREEAIRLSNMDHQVVVFSSNGVKGTTNRAASSEKMNNIKIRRFPFKKLGGESFMYFDFEKEALNFSPDVIIAHNYRHLHTTKALKIAKKLRKKGKKCKVFLVTHAPFVEGNITRKWHESLLVYLYDRLVSPFFINNFDKILAISHWEVPFLLSAGAKRDKIEYLPNGIPEEFFIKKLSFPRKNNLLFLGRVSSKKKLDTLVRSVPLIKEEVHVEIIGPKEEPYAAGIEKLIKNFHLEKKVLILPPVYNLQEKINKIDSCRIFVLPSRVEGMPQALIEAMARGRVVIGSNSVAIRDLITDKKNGFLFEFDNPKDLANKINTILKLKKSEIDAVSKEAVKSVKNFSWNNVIKKLEKIIHEN